MAKPDPEAFQKTVLWHLASLHVEIHQLKHQLGSVWQVQTGKDGKELVELFEKETAQMHKIVYHAMLDQAGLKDDESNEN